MCVVCCWLSALTLPLNISRFLLLPMTLLVLGPFTLKNSIVDFLHLIVMCPHYSFKAAGKWSSVEVLSTKGMYEKHKMLTQCFRQSEKMLMLLSIIRLIMIPLDANCLNAAVNIVIKICMFVLYNEWYVKSYIKRQFKELKKTSYFISWLIII